MLLNDGLLLETYGQYLQKMKVEPDHTQYADYGWENVPETLNFSWLAYSLMLPEFSRSLANIVNQLGNYARRLKSWDKVLSTYDEDLRLELLFEFVEPIATVSLTLPYAIQSRFFFSIAHLSHQANKTKLGPGWKDDLPDDRDIAREVARKYGVYWSSYAAFDASVVTIFSEKHRLNTDDFRHKHTHRVPTQVVLGHAGLVRRGKDTKGRGVKYEFGDRPPIDISVLADELSTEFHRSLAAFRDFKLVVAEQVEEIKRNNSLP
jgi:hypothetical protein